jgi:hypothetical protein
MAATPCIFRRLQLLLSAQRPDMIVIRTSFNKTGITEKITFNFA